MPEDSGSGSAFSFGNQYWVIDSSIPDGSFSTSIIFYFDEEFLDDLEESEIELMYRENSDSLWTTYPEQKVDTVQNKLTILNVDHFSIFAIADDPYSSPNDPILKEFVLFQNYPNPFNHSTIIRYGLPKPSHVKIEIFDILGRRVATLLKKEIQAGYHVIEFDGSQLSSGIYLYRIQADNFVDVKKMVLIK